MYMRSILENIFEQVYRYRENQYAVYVEFKEDEVKRVKKYGSRSVRTSVEI